MLQLIWPLVVAFAVAIAIGPIVLPVLRRLKLGQNVRDDGPQAHLVKAGTPTMGGVIFLIAAVVATAIFVRGNLQWICFAVLATLGFGAIGFLDDFIKVYKKRSLGLRPYQKIIGQFGLALVMALFAYYQPEIGSELYVPGFDISWDLGWFYIPFTIFVVIAVTNSVNLTDGLDGLASGVSVIDCLAFAVMAYGLATQALSVGDVQLSADLKNVAVFGSAMAGGCLGFLRTNSYPAKVFMGDTGSLALGAAISAIAILTKMQLFIPIMGIMFVMSSLSSIIQSVSFKLRHKRVFKMAPLHHHFELSGMHETRIVALYVIITVIACLIAFLLMI